MPVPGGSCRFCPTLRWQEAESRTPRRHFQITAHIVLPAGASRVCCAEILLATFVHHSVSIRAPYNDLVIRLFFCLLSATVLLPAQRSAPFDVVEATIAQVHDAMRGGRLTCRELVG